MSDGLGALQAQLTEALLAVCDKRVGWVADQIGDQSVLWADGMERPITVGEAVWAVMSVFSTAAPHPEDETPQSSEAEEIKPFVRLEMTCEVCPTQWDAWDADGRYYYIRYRYGFLRVDGDEVGGPTLFLEQIGGPLDGDMTEEEMLTHISDTRV